MKSESALSWLLKTGDLEELKRELADVNALVKGRTPLHIAADFGQTEVLAWLLSRGAAVEALDRDGLSVLLAAVAEDHEDAVRLLLLHGADPSRSGPDGRPYAEWTSNPDIKALLNR